MSSISRRRFNTGAAVTAITTAALARGSKMSAEAAQEVAQVQKAVPIITEQLLHATALLEVSERNGQNSTGTGFFYQFFNHNGLSLSAIVTNRHVVENALTVSCTFTEATKDQTPVFGKTKRIPLTGSSSDWIFHPDPTVDLAVALIGDGVSKAAARGENYMLSYSDQSLIPTESEYRDLTPLEDVLIVGYPDGISDTVNNVPVFRRGITATPVYLDFRGMPQFLLDAAIFPGSSGSPVFLFNQGAWAPRSGGLQMGARIKLIGIIYAVAQHQTNGEIVFQPAPTQNLPSVRSLIPNNIGACIKSSKILDFEPLFVKRGLKPPEGYEMRSKLIL